MPQAQYKKMMLEKLEERRREIVNRILQQNPNHRFLTKEELRRVIPGTLAAEPKKSTRHEKRPLVLSVSAEAKQGYLDWYFPIYRLFTISFRKSLSIEITV